MKSKIEKALDARIGQLYHANFSGKVIPIMATVKIFNAARAASDQGEAAMVSAMAEVVNAVALA